MIAFFNGPPGAGKTFHGTAYALHCLDRGERTAVSWAMVPPDGVKLYDLRTMGDDGEKRTPDLSMAQANAVMGPVLFRFSELVELFGLRRVQVFKDEAQNDLGSRDWEKMPLRVRIWMSEHRHYMVNLFLYTQHFKFVDIYPRRLAIGNVFSIVRLLHLTIEFARPDADSETGDLGRLDLFSLRIVRRPWHSLDIPVPWPTFWKLFYDLSPRVPMHYRTHDPHEDRLEKNPPRSGGAAPPPSPTHPSLPF